MAFDIQGALKEGYSLPEIVDYLGGQKKFDVAGARSEGYSDQEILDFLSPKKKEEGIGTALRRGAEQLVSTGQTALESITKGGEEAAIRGRERQADIQARLGEGASLERLLETYRQQGLLAAGKELAGQIPSAIAEQVPGIATTLAGAGAGAAAGSVVPGVGTVIGGLAGAVAPSLIQQYGGNIQRQAEAQAATGKPLQIERGTAAATAVPQAALDVAATFIPLGGRLASSVFGPKVGQMLMQSSAEGREKLFKESLLSTVLKGTAVGVAAEVPTEVVQTMLERAQADLPVLTDDALREYGEVAFATSLLGPIGIIGRVSNKAEAGRMLAEAQQKAIDTNELQQVEIQTEEKEEPTVLFVSPSGDVAQSLEQLDEINKIKQQQGMPQQRTVTESYASEEDRIAAEKAAYDRARKYSPTMQALDKLVEDRKAREQAQIAKIDEMKAAQSAFSTAEPVAGLYRPPTAEEIAIEEEKAKQFTNTRTVIRKTPEGIKVYEGTMNKTGTAVNVIENGKKLTFNPNNPNIVIDPTEKDIYRFETDSMADEARALSGKVEEAKIKFNKSALEFKQWLRDPKHQLKQEVFSDTIAPRKRTKEDQFRALSPKVSKGFFAKKPGEGLELDMAAEMAFDAGFLSADEFYNPEDPDGREAFTEKLKAAYDNEPVVTPRSADLYSDYETINQQLRNLEDEIDRRKESLAQEYPAVVGELTPEEQEAEAARVAEASTRYEVKPKADVIDFNKYKAEKESLIARSNPAIMESLGAQLDRLQKAYDQNLITNSDIQDLERTFAKYDNDALMAITAIKRKVDGVTKRPKLEAGKFLPSDRFIQEGKELFAEMRQALDQMGLKNVGLKFEDTMTRFVDGKLDEVTGSYFNNLITASLSSTNVKRTVNHEAIHAMKDLGLFTDAEWKILSNKAKNQWIKKYDPDGKRYGSEPMDVRIEEAIADAFGDYRTQPANIKTIFDKIIDFMDMIRNYFAGRGFRTIDDVFKRAEEGRLAGKTVEARATEKLEKTPWSEQETPNAFGRELSLTTMYNKMRDAYTESDSPDQAYQAAYDASTPGEQYILRQLQKDGLLGFDYPHQAIQAIIQEPQNFDISPGLKTAISRLGNKEARFEVPTRAKVRAPLTGVDPKYVDKLLKQFTAEKATVKQRFEGLKENFFERMVIGVFDEFRTIKKYSDEAYMMARMSKSIDGGLQGLLEHGEVFNDGGALKHSPRHQRAS
jgi:hypothetical protein